jgi:Bacterial protein of unknown function (YtfJ_HI0045)
MQFPSPKTRKHAIFAQISLFVLVSVTSVTAMCLPRVGGLRPALVVADVDGGTLDLRAINGKPTLVVYESKEASNQNLALKDELSKLAAGELYRKTVILVPVADVESYDYWPARGFVKSAIRDESRKLNATIYADWDGSFRKSAGLKRDKSTIILIGRDAKIRFVYEGTLPKGERTRLIALLRAEVEPETSALPDASPVSSGVESTKTDAGAEPQSASHQE